MHYSTGLVSQSLAGAGSDAWRALQNFSPSRWSQLPEPEMRSEGIHHVSSPEPLGLNDGLWGREWKSIQLTIQLNPARFSLLRRKHLRACEETWGRLVGKSIKRHVQLSGRSHAMLAAHNIARDLYKGHMTIMRSRHGNSIAEWWRSFFKKGCPGVLKTTKQKGSLCTAAPSPNGLQKGRLVIFYLVNHWKLHKSSSGCFLFAIGSCV